MMDNVFYVSDSGIIFEKKYNQELTETIIKNITNILKKKKNKVVVLPTNYNFPIDSLPDEIETLRILALNDNIKVSKWSKNLKKLSLGLNYNHPIDNLPEGLEELALSNAFNKSLDNLPSSLIKLEIFGDFNQCLNNLPYNLQILKINSYSFFHSLDNLPSTLKILSLSSDNYNYSLDNLPDKLEELEIRGKFNLSFTKLPKNLIKISGTLLESTIFYNNLLILINEHNENNEKKIIQHLLNL